MGRFDASALRYLNPEDFRVLATIEKRMKYNEYVPQHVVEQSATLNNGGYFKVLSKLTKHKLAVHDRNKKHDGYRLTDTGCNYLALNALRLTDIIASIGNQVGTGKESGLRTAVQEEFMHSAAELVYGQTLMTNQELISVLSLFHRHFFVLFIFLVADDDGNEMILKFCRLGKSFTKVKEKRDFHIRKGSNSWKCLSKRSAEKEFKFMQVLYEYKFPVPKPITYNRHCVLMEVIKGYPLYQVHKVSDPATLYDELMNLILRLANHGLIHSDFNEFNLILDENDKPILIDFPQIVSTSHENAKEYFDRDVNCIKEFFKRRFNYESELYPTFNDVIPVEVSLDDLTCASGYKKKVRPKNYETSRLTAEEKQISDDEDSLDQEQNEEANADKDMNEPVLDKSILLHRYLEGYGQVLKINEKENLPKLAESFYENSVEITDLSGNKVPQNNESDYVGSIPKFTASVCRKSKACSLRSISTISPEEVKQRVKKEHLKQQKKIIKKRITAKGEASAVNRSRRENIDNIKQSSTFDDWEI